MVSFFTLIRCGKVRHYCWNGHQVTNVLHNWSTSHIFTRHCNRIVNYDFDKLGNVAYGSDIRNLTLIRCNNKIRDKVVGCVIEGV